MAGLVPLVLIPNWALALKGASGQAIETQRYVQSAL